MSIFKSIDEKLYEFAKKHNGRLEGSEFFENLPKDGEQQRTIFWEDGLFSKTIFISPSAFVDKGWNFIIDASLIDNGETKGEIPFWQKEILNGVQFSEIERQIDYLLSESEKLLSSVKVADMRLDWTYLDGKLVDIRINRD